MNENEEKEGLDLDEQEHAITETTPTADNSETVRHSEGPVIDFCKSEDSSAKPSTTANPRPRHRGRRFLTILIFIAIAVGGVAFYIQFLNPYATEARATGYITSVEKRGIFFKTYEAEMITEDSLTDTAGVYNRPMTFSIPSDSIARILQDMQGSRQSVTVLFERYNATLPWRGNSKNVITGIIDR